MKRLKDCDIKDQAYYIIVALEGSWLYNAMHVQMEDEAFCKELVRCWEESEGVGTRGQIEDYINCDGSNKEGI